MENSYYAAILALYGSNCKIDEEAMRNYIQFLLEHEVKGFFPCGTSGEYINLTKEENLKILKIVLEENNGKKQVIPCASTASLFTTLELLKSMRKLGVDTVSICPPYYTPLRQQDILDYYQNILDHTDLNIYLYNIPAFTNPIAFETFEALLQKERIKGIKDSSGNMKIISRYVAKKKQIRNDFKVMTGTDEMILSALSGGCFGSVSALSGIVPEAHNLLFATYQKDPDLAFEIQTKITLLANECEKFVFPVGYKIALEARGFNMPAFRQNVVESKDVKEYEKSKEQIYELVKELVTYVKENKKNENC